MNPPIRGDYLLGEYSLFERGRMVWGLVRLKLLVLFLVRMDMVSKPLFPAALDGGPLFAVFILGGFPVVIYFGGSEIAFFLE